MNILFDIGHPAHVHYYRILAKKLELKGHKVFWTVKDIFIAKKLLDIYGFKYKVFSKKSDSLIGKILKQIYFDLLMFFYVKKNKIEIAIGTSITIAHVSKITRLTSFVFDDDDDEVQPLVAKFLLPYADILLSPDVLRGKRKRKDTIFYPGYHELAYLHPNHFIPNESILNEFGLKKNEIFFIMRFNVFKAHHDVGVKGLSLQQKLDLIDLLNPYGKIFITTERDIEPELKDFQLKVSPEKAHNLMFFSTIFLGDSQTMSSEAAVLGVPSIRCNSFAGRISYLEEEEHKYKLTFAYRPEDFSSMISKIKELLEIKGLKSEWEKRRSNMLKDKIDVTAFWLWFIENYPKSKNLLIDSPEFWQKFK